MCGRPSGHSSKPGPQSSTDVLREEWVQEPEKYATIFSHIMGVRNSMEMAKELVEENTRVAQAKQKAYYDRKTKELNLQPGDKVLLLLPSSTKKFVAQGQRPYELTRRTRKLNYEIRILDKGGCQQVFYINHLRKWQERTCEANAVIDDEEGIEEYCWSNKH